MNEKLRLFFANNMLSTLQGCTMGQWFAELAANRFLVHPRYWLRAAVVSISTPVNSLFAWRVQRKFGAEIDAAQVVEPIFILGHWRSGTTLLQRLFALDRRFCYPTFYECIFPRGFILSEKRNSERYSAMMPAHRLFDNMSNHMSAPAEEEFGLCTLTGLSPYMGWCFPRRQDYYDRFLTFEQATSAQRERWKQAYRAYAKRLTFYHGGRRLVLKSPPHTARVKLILEAFPDAKFVHIHRDPTTVFSSSQKMLKTFMRSTRLQTYDAGDLDERIVRNYKSMHAALLRDRELAPAGRWHELGFARLESEPLAAVAEIYEKLGLPAFDDVRPAVQQYFDEQKNYRKNEYPELTDDLRRRLAAEWAPFYAAWGYPPPA